MRFNLSPRGAAWPAIAFAAILAVGGCASGHPHPGGPPRTIVHLTNDLAPPADVTVYAVSSDGIRRLLGDVPPNGHKVLRVPDTLRPGTSYRLVAERPLNRPIVSQPITGNNYDLMIDWDLQTNAMWFPSDSGS